MSATNSASEHSQGVSAALVVLGLASMGHWIGHGWLGHGLYKVGLLAVPLLAGVRFSRPLRPSGRSVLGGVGLGLLLGAAAAGLVASLLPRFVDPSALRASFDARYGTTPATVLVAALAVATMNALLEEWFYRGFLDARIGASFASFIFGVQHAIVLSGLAGPLPAFLAGALCVPAGLVWSSLARRTGGILVPFLSHMAADLVLFAAGLRILGWW